MDTQRTTSLDDVRLAIFRQHTQLAQLLDELEEHAAAVLDGRGERASLHTALTLLQTRFLRHLAYEETHLPSFLAGEALLADHPEQRLRMDGLVHDDVVFSDASTLAHEAQAFVRAIRKDIVEEDSKLRALR